MNLAAVLVDVDGTLVDSNYHHVIAWSRALRDHGEEARLAAIHRLVGMGGSDLVENLIGRTDDQIEASWRTHFDRLLDEVHPLPGAAALLRGLHQRGLTVALATSSPKDLLGVLRRTIDADDAIDEAIDSSDVGDAKPAPDVFTVALDRLGVAAHDAIVIGDSVWDVEAAHRADLACIGLESGGFSDHELLDAGAKQIYRDPQDLLDHLDDALG